MHFNDLLDTNIPFEFYGVNLNKFKLGTIVFEAIEDPNDGYRSYLESVELSSSPAIFSKRPLAIVTVKTYEDGFTLVDQKTNHVWLSVYTDALDDYYPYFTFSYSPDETKQDYEVTGQCPSNYPELFI